MKDENEVVQNEEAEIDELPENLESSAEETTEIVEEEVEAEEEKATEAESDAVAENEEEAVAEMETQSDETVEALSKYDEAKLLVEKARSIVNESEAQLEECKLLLASDLEEYEKAKQELKDNGLTESEALLEKLNYKSEEGHIDNEDTVIFEPKEELAPIVIQDVSSGGFTGFVLALIAGVITYLAMVYVAAMKSGITFYASHAFLPEALKPIMQWYASLVGMENNPTVGGGMIVLAVLLVMWIIYKIRVSLKASSNLRMAQEQLASAEAYAEQKGTCKEEMDKVDAYIHEAIKTLNTYEVVLHEQKAKLMRILHIEEEKIESADFHHKSNTEMKDTSELINAIKDFMSVPMSEEGRLSGKSSLFLHRAKSKVQKVLDRFY